LCLSLRRLDSFPRCRLWTIGSRFRRRRSDRLRRQLIAIVLAIRLIADERLLLLVLVGAEAGGAKR
jgi:hypothetical protein